MSFKIKCVSCRRIEKKSIIACNSCLKSLEIENTDTIDINNFANNIFLRYQCFFPQDIREFFEEYPNNSTPVIRLTGNKIYAKLEYCSFSSSSKDREAFVEIAVAKKLGYKGIIVTSTGNMGAALASLCAVYKLPCFVFVPIDTSETKIKQIKQFGAIIKKVPGIYDDIVPMTVESAKEKKLFLGSLQAFRFEGYKTIAYEIYETFGENLPRNIIVPLGDATTYVGIWKGFKDLILAGLIKKCPSLQLHPDYELQLPDGKLIIEGK